MMFPFTYEFEIGSVSLAQIEGFASVVSCTSSPCAIASVWVHEAGDPANAEPIPEKHPLYQPIMMWLLNERRGEIEWAWGQHENWAKYERVEA
jgi:hypothetical protein